MSFSCSVTANNITESVAVVSFQPSTQVMFKSTFNSFDATEELVGTNVFTMCLRYMTRFLSGFECIFETNQMKFCVFQKYAFFFTAKKASMFGNKEVTQFGGYGEEPCRKKKTAFSSRDIAVLV